MFLFTFKFCFMQGPGIPIYLSSWRINFQYWHFDAIPTYQEWQCGPWRSWSRRVPWQRCFRRGWMRKGLRRKPGIGRSSSRQRAECRQSSWGQLALYYQPEWPLKQMLNWGQSTKLHEPWLKKKYHQVFFIGYVVNRKTKETILDFFMVPDKTKTWPAKSSYHSKLLS